MAQIQLVADKTGKSVIACIDDLAAELDAATKNKAMDSLLRLPAQLFITNTEQAETKGLTAQDYQMFHVEHGMIRPVPNS
jgi:DNA replication and repair protein RecF